VARELALRDKITVLSSTRATFSLHLLIDLLEQSNGICIPPQVISSP
jgi:hypothetical protein